MARTREEFAQMSSKKLNEIYRTACEEEAVIIEKLLADRGQELKLTKSIDDYKSEFAALYQKMINEMGVEHATVITNWKAEWDKDNNKTYVPQVTITF